MRAIIILLAIKVVLQGWFFWDFLAPKEYMVMTHIIEILEEGKDNE